MAEPSNKRPAWTIRFFPFAISAFSRPPGTLRAATLRDKTSNILILLTITNPTNAARALLCAMRCKVVEPPKHFGSSVASHMYPCYFALSIEPPRLSGRPLVTVLLNAFKLVNEPKA